MMSFLVQYNKDWSFPRVIDIAKEIEYSALDPNVIGRVDSSELNTEYLFGMFSTFGQSQNTSLIGVPLNQTIVELIIQGNSMSVSLIVMFNWTVEIIPVQFNAMFSMTISQNLWKLKLRRCKVFNDVGKITQYDAQLVRSSWIFPLILPKLAPILAKELHMPDTTDPAILVTARAAYDICSAHAQYCTGTLRQYRSTESCMDFITNDIQFGDIYQAGQNTGICRYLHSAMLAERPQVHCPHIGPSGGDMCYNRPYSDEVLGKPFNSPFINIPGELTLEEAFALVYKD
ncbi:hypothetical protein D9757_014947 [Collybiopsis confluens]|uniref:Uncharacterized protein n=1 Tax=Collybiopsis confluens TaxID=2823264 RepID=A0A8H5CT65_9AGAR|nr:hypothetical protein D9757_014947 [Collybiopsis confluens]